LLRAQGEQIHVFWLTGFIFFGSSNRLFENIRRVMDKEATDVRYIVMDFAGVSGFDTSALLSLVKLRNLCDERDVTLVYSGLSVTMLLALEQAELFGSGRRHQAFPSRNEALEWCEEQVLAAHAPADSDADQDGFEVWLARELGGEVDPAKVTAYFERKVIEGGHILYRSGEPADTIDLVASGSIAITVADSLNRPLRMRRMSGQTVVGEMGFFRRTVRAASVGAEGSTVVYTLTRDSFDRMLRDDPQVGIAFLQFIIRALSDRVEFANQEIAALI
jgi:SulP family sulfate permease